MPKIPSYRRRRLPSTNVGAAPLDPSAANQAGTAVGAGLASIGKGLGDIGQALAEIEAKKRELRDNAAIADAVHAENDFTLNKERELEARVYTDPQQADEDRQLAASELQQLRDSQKDNMSQEAYANYLNRSKLKEASRLRRLEGIIWRKEVTLGQSKAAIALRDAHILEMSGNESAAQESIEAIKAGYEQYFPPGAFEEMVESSKIAALKTLGTQNGDMEAFEKAKEIVRSSTAISAEEALAELQRIDKLKEYTQNKASSAKKVRNLAIDEDFLGKIITSDLRQDEIEQSRLDESTKGMKGFQQLSKEQWTLYAEDSYKTPPETTTPEGLDVVISTITDYGKNVVDKEGAYRQLLDARYVDRALTQQEFEWAIEKIQNQYPRAVINDIETIAETNLKTVAKGWPWGTHKSEREEAKKVNLELLYWIDGQIAKDKVPTREEMNEISAQLIAQDGTLPKPTDEDLTQLSPEELLKRIKQ